LIIQNREISKAILDKFELLKDKLFEAKFTEANTPAFYRTKRETTITP
jgi:hypothetical protein